MNTHNRIIRPALPAALAALLIAGCSAPAGEDTPAETPAEAGPQDAFFDALASHCGKAYEGALVSNDAADADFAGAPMVMHVAECSLPVLPPLRWRPELYNLPALDVK